MFIELIGAIALLICLLLVPGCIFLRACGIDGLRTICAAPLASVALIAIAGEVLAALGIQSTPILIVVLTCAVPAVGLLLRKNYPVQPIQDMPRWTLLLAVGLACAIGSWVFLAQLPSPDAFLQQYDSAHHINLVQAMAQSGKLSSLAPTSYLTPADTTIIPYIGTKFFPSAWSILCALLVMILACSVPLAINASMFVMMCVVWPLGCMGVALQLFSNKRAALYASALLTCAFAAFPWNLSIYGPLYPNVAGFAVAPCAMTLFLPLIAPRMQLTARIACACGLALSCIGLVLVHPNSTFTCAVFLSPYCIYRLWHELRARKLDRACCALACGALVGVFVGFWVLCFYLPFMHELVSYSWSPHATLPLMIANVAELVFTRGFYADMPGQHLLSLLVGIGLIAAARNREHRWLCASWLLGVGATVISGTTTGLFRQMVAGFWYTDPMRMAALCVVVCLPLAALGAGCLYEKLEELVQKLLVKQVSGFPLTKIKTLCALSCSILLVGAIFCPTLSWPLKLPTTFGEHARHTHDDFRADTPLSSRELAFLQRVSAIVGPHDLIINDPLDGSFLAYGCCNLRVYWRYFTEFGALSETNDSKILRRSLFNYAQDPRVQKAVEHTDARWFLRLSSSGSSSSFISLTNSYSPGYFLGLTGIRNTTPGFELVLQEDDMALYRIIR